MLETVLDAGGCYRYPKVRGLFAFLRQGLAMYPRLASNSQVMQPSCLSLPNSYDSEPGSWGAMEVFMQPTDWALRRAWTRGECCGQDPRARPAEESR